MNPILYNSAVAAGVALTSVGAGVEWGWPIGMIVAGVLIIALSLATLSMLVR